jgi:hypothetical protein
MPEWKEGWTSSYDDSEWSDVKVALHSKDILMATQNEPVKDTRHLVRERSDYTKGEQVIDFGQNLVGRIRMKSAQVVKGRSITCRST